jgi:hypothetical protein
MRVQYLSGSYCGGGAEIGARMAVQWCITCARYLVGVNDFEGLFRAFAALWGGEAACPM